MAGLASGKASLPPTGERGEEEMPHGAADLSLTGNGKVTAKSAPQLIQA